MLKKIYLLFPLIGIASSLLQAQPVIKIKADYYPDYEYLGDESAYSGVATGDPIEITASVDKGGTWSNLPTGKTYPDNSLILTEITTADGKVVPMEQEGMHRFKAMPANIKTPPFGDRSYYLKAIIQGYGKRFKPENQNKYAWYITSGRKGLDLSTGVANIPTGDIYYGSIVVDLERVEDDIPDLIVTQIADPSNNNFDKFRFLDKNNKEIPGTKTVQVNFSSVKPLGSRNWNFYYSDNNSWAHNGARQLRIVAFYLKDFGINKDNYKQVAKLVYSPSGDSDSAFLAVDEYSMIVYRNDCEGTSDIGSPGGAKVGISTLQRGDENWLSDNSGAYLELESSKKGFVITQNADPASTISNPEEGMLVWDTTDNCLKIYNDILGTPQWHCIEKCTKQ